MSNTTNAVMIFIGGMAVGSLITVGIMKKFGCNAPNSSVEDTSINDISDDPFTPKKDKPSYADKKSVNTHKRNYTSPFVKPDLDEVSKRYGNDDFDKEMAAREHPEDDIPEESEQTEARRAKSTLDQESDPKDLRERGDETEEEDDEELEIGEASSYHFSPDDLELEEIDGYGHVVCELHSKRSSSLIYLISDEFLGEIYPIESLTYYERDNVLCDKNDAVVDDISMVVGDALEHFGDHCGDKDMVYVRNCSISMEYEITRVNGYYAAKIYGIKDEDFEGGAMAKIPRKSRKKHAKATEDGEEE